jgi:glyoxylase-like metal-dependent hydrolase (beta-lactamase superfamily II)
VLIEGIPLWLAQTNCWIVAPDGPGGECVLVDAPPDPAGIVARLAHHDLRVAAIFSTHGHVDHIGGVGTLVHGAHHHGPADGRAIEVRIHEADEHMLRDPVGTSGMFGAYLEGLDVRPPEQIFGIDDGEKITGCGMTFTALHTPGHTMGSVCFTLEIDGYPPVLFSGDHLFAGSIGRTDLPGGSFEALMESMAEKILPLPDELQVLPGHGGTTTLGQERRTNPFILELLQRGRDR